MFADVGKICCVDDDDDPPPPPPPPGAVFCSPTEICSLSSERVGLFGGFKMFASSELIFSDSPKENPRGLSEGSDVPSLLSRRRDSSSHEGGVLSAEGGTSAARNPSIC